MNNFWNNLERPARIASKALQARPFFVLAPMAGYTDQPFRLMCKKYGVDVMYSEMVSSEAIFHNTNPKPKAQNSKQIPNSKIQLLKTLNLIKFSEAERPFVVQIFGADPEHIAFAAEYIASGQWAKDYLEIQSSLKIKNCLPAGEVGELKIASIPSGIDVNMGCPVRDVVKTGAGAALLKNPKLAVKIIRAIKKKVKNIPISVKTRLGWDDSKNIPTFCRMLEDADIDALAIHGRTYKQGFTGPVDWEMIYKIKKQLKIQVIGNGGINMNNESGIMNYAKKLDGVMIGTGALGRPWIFEKLKTLCHSGLDPESHRSRNEPALPAGRFGMTKDNIKQNILEHARLVQKLKGERGIIEFRKHMSWYLKGLPNIKETKKQLVRVNSYSEIEEILSKK